MYRLENENPKSKGNVYVEKISLYVAAVTVLKMELQLLLYKLCI